MRIAAERDSQKGDPSEASGGEAREMEGVLAGPRSSARRGVAGVMAAALSA